MRYRFTLSIVVDGKPYAAGDEADAKDIPAGCLASMVRLGQVVQAEKPAPKK